MNVCAPALRSLVTVLGCLVFIKASSTNYYISTTGSDANPGTSSITPWQTTDKINSVDLEPGDSVFFERGGSYSGTLQLDGSDHGSASVPVVVAAYGSGSAPIIFSGTANGIVLYNSDGIVIRDIEVQGSGVASNTGYGISIYMDTVVNLTNVTLKKCIVSGFNQDGIVIASVSAANGFQDILVDSCISHDNGTSGIASYGSSTIYSHQNITVRQCKAFSNNGLTTQTTQPSGSGIVLSSVNGALIEYCEAYDNGINNRDPSSGPNGIWMYEVSSGTIQYSESHHNKAGLTHDGGGFDIDGGCQHCIIQYCYSHDNEGAGFLMAEYGSSATYTDNTIRFNISQNDARKNGYGAITVWGSTASARVNDSYVYNNTVFLDDNNLINGIPTGIYLIGSNFTQAKVLNNIIYGQGNVELIHATAAPDSNALHLVANFYYSTSPDFFWNGIHYATLNSWESAAPTQEKRASTQYGMNADPMLTAPGSGSTVGDQTQLSNQLMGYEPQTGSPVCGAGISIMDDYSQNPGATDFFGSSLPATTVVGAGVSACNIVTPVKLTAWSAVERHGKVYLNWNTTTDNELGEIFLERSEDGIHFTTLSNFAAQEGAQIYNYVDLPDSYLRKLYYRLKIKNGNAQVEYSTTLAVTLHSLITTPESILAPLTNPVTGKITVVVINNIDQPCTLSIFNSIGKQVKRMVINKSNAGQIVNIDNSENWKPGIYFVMISSSAPALQQSFSILKN